MLFWYRWRQPMGNASSRLPYAQIHPSRTLRSSSRPVCEPSPPSPYRSQSVSRHRVRYINPIFVYCSLTPSLRPSSVTVVNVFEPISRSIPSAKRQVDRPERPWRAILLVDQSGQSWREDNIRRKGAMQWRRQKKVTHVIGSSNHVLLLARYQDGTETSLHTYYSCKRRTQPYNMLNQYESIYKENWDLRERYSERGERKRCKVSLIAVCELNNSFASRLLVDQFKYFLRYILEAQAKY